MTPLSDLQKTVQELNDAQYKSIVDLVIGHKYAIRKIEVIKNGGSERVCVHCRDFKIVLPESASSRVTQKHVQQINGAGVNMIYVVYNGIRELKNGKRTYDIVFALDSEVE